MSTWHYRRWLIQNGKAIAPRLLWNCPTIHRGSARGATLMLRWVIAQPTYLFPMSATRGSARAPPPLGRFRPWALGWAALLLQGPPRLRARVSFGENPRHAHGVVASAR